MSEALRDHLKRTGISPALIKQLGTTSTVVEVRLGSGNGAGSYLPFGEHFAGYTPKRKHEEAANYIIDTVDHVRNLHARSRNSRQLPNSKSVKPVLLHEREMRRLGHSVNPTATARNPMEKTAYGPLAPAGKPVGMYKGDLRY